MTATVSVTPVTRDVTRRPAGLGGRGRRLWDATTDGVELQPAELVLLEEACRVADRLDRLDALLRGDEDTWLRFRTDLDSGEVTVYVDKALSEARQQQVALKALVSELRASRAAAGKPVARKAEAAPVTQAGKGAGVVTDLTARIADLRRQAAGQQPS